VRHLLKLPWHHLSLTWGRKPRPHPHHRSNCHQPHLHVPPRWSHTYWATGFDDLRITNRGATPARTRARIGANKASAQLQSLFTLTIAVNFLTFDDTRSTNCALDPFVSEI